MPDEDDSANGYDAVSETDSQHDTNDGTGAGTSDTAAGVDDADGSDAMDSTSDESTARTGETDDVVGDLDATIDTETQHDVEVPALDDRAEVVTGGGTASTDPGDHRGQPWSTSPGEPGPEEGNDLDTDTVDDGLDGPLPDGVGSGSADGSGSGSGSSGNVTTGAALGSEQEATPTETASEEVGVGDHQDDPATTDADPVDAGAASDPAPAEGSSADELVGDDDQREHDGDDRGAAVGSVESDSGAVGTVEDVSEGASEDPTDDGPLPSDQGSDTTGSASGAQTGRRISDFEEVADGGYGVGSAATLHDGAQPLGHAVKGSHDGNTFLTPDDEGYDDTEPDVWFYDEDAARRAGFGRRGE